MSESIKRSFINLITKKTKNTSQEHVIGTAFKDFKKKFKRNHSVGKAWLMNDEKSIFGSRTTRTSSVNNQSEVRKRETDINKFFNICNSGSNASQSAFSSLSDLSESASEKSQEIDKEMKVKFQKIQKTANKKIKISPKKYVSHHVAFFEARSQLQQHSDRHNKIKTEQYENQITQHSTLVEPIQIINIANQHII